MGRPKTKPPIPKSKLEDEYLNQKLSIREVAERNKPWSVSSIRGFLIKYDIPLRTAGETRRADLEGKVIGQLTVLHTVGKDSKRSILWLCECECGNLVKKRSQDLTKGLNIGCGCNTTSSRMIGKNNPLYTGYEEISGAHWGKIKSSAKRRKIELTITLKEIWDLFIKQNRVCALSGRLISFGKTTTDETTASLDRVDSSKGYHINNVQWVHKDVNRAKQYFDNEYFIALCKEIANYA